VKPPEYQKSHPTYQQHKVLLGFVFKFLLAPLHEMPIFTQIKCQIMETGDRRGNICSAGVTYANVQFRSLHSDHISPQRRSYGSINARLWWSHYKKVPGTHINSFTDNEKKDSYHGPPKVPKIWRYNPEDSHLRTNRHENPKSYRLPYV
jgi:hypothetical protein